MTTFAKKDGTIVPCGNCPNCRKRRASNWSFRLLQELKISDSAYFLTLTYDTQHVPITPKGYMSLSQTKYTYDQTGKRKVEQGSDVQLFFKRLRKSHEKSANKSIKYYAAAEYGGQTLRPHYHLILFNAQLQQMFTKQHIKELEWTNFDGRHHIRAFQWDNGTVTVGKVEPASVGYCLKYISKPKIIPLHKNDDRIPEYALMSINLGASYLTENMVRWHTADINNRMYVNLQDGKKASMPRYYKQKMYYDGESSDLAFAKKKENKTKLLPDEKTRRDLIDGAYRRERWRSTQLSNNKI